MSVKKATTPPNISTTKTAAAQKGKPHKNDADVINDGQKSPLQGNPAVKVVKPMKKDKKGA